MQVSPASADAEVGQTLRFSAVGVDGDGSLWTASRRRGLLRPSTSAQPTRGPRDGVRARRAEGRRHRQRQDRLGDGPHQTAAGGASRHRPARRRRWSRAQASGSRPRTSRDGIPRKDVPVTWRSESPAVATVDAAGVVTGIAPGRAVPSAQPREQGSGTTTLTVIENPDHAHDRRAAHHDARTGDVVRFTARAPGRQRCRACSGRSAAKARRSIPTARSWPSARAPTSSRPPSAATPLPRLVVTPRATCSARWSSWAARPLEEFQTLEQWVFGNYLYATSAMAGSSGCTTSPIPRRPLKVDSLAFDARILNDVSVTADGNIGVVTREGASNRKNGIVFLDTSDPAHPKVALGIHRDGVRRRAQRVHRRPVRLPDRRRDGIDARDRLGGSEEAEGGGALGDREPAGPAIKAARRRSSPAGGISTTCR